MPSRRRTNLKQILTDITLIVIGVVCAFIGLKGFLVPNKLIDGGVTGVAMLAATLLETSLPLLLLLINLPFVVWGYRKLGSTFGLICMVSIFGLAILLHTASIETITSDRLLAAVFGGVFIGAGVGLTIRGGGVLDGTEILALFLEKRIPFSLGDVVLALNVVIFSVAAAFLGVEPALYSVLTYWAAARTADFILSGIEEYNGILIVSDHQDEIKDAIYETFQRGVTILRGFGGYNKEEIEVLFCVTTRLELPKLRALLKEIDEHAFFCSHRISDAQGGLTKRNLSSARS